MATEEERKDAVLLKLAENAVQPGTGDEIPPQPGAGPNAQGLDLSSYDTPNQPAPAAGAPNPNDKEELARQATSQPSAAPVAPDGTPVGQTPTGTTADPSDVASIVQAAKDEPGPPQAPAPVTPPSRTPTTPTEKGSVEALNQARSSGYAAANAKAAEAPAMRQKSELDAQALEKQSAANQANADEIQRKQDAIETGRAQVQKIQEAAYQDLSKFKFYQFWRDADEGDRMQARIAIMLGAWGSSGPYAATSHNVALEQINGNIDRQFKADESEVRKRYDMAKLREQGAEQFEKNMQSDLAVMKFKQSAASLAVADEMKAEMLRNGIPLEQAQNDTAVKQMIAKADQADAEGYEKLMQIHGNLALERAKLDSTRPDSPQVQTATSDFIDKHPGDQAGAMHAAQAAGSRNPTMTVTKLMNEPDRVEAARNKSLEKVGNATAALRRERIATNIHDMGEALKSIKPGVITPEVLDNIQSNEAEMHATSHPGSMIGALGNNLGRKAGMVAKSPYDGLTTEQANAARAMDRVLMHGSEMQQAQGEGVKKQYYETYKPQPGTDQSSINNAINALANQYHDYKAILDNKDIGSRADTAKGSSPSQKYTVGSVVTSKGKMYRVTDDSGNVEPM